MIKYCIKCGQSVEHKIPEGDDKPRAVCTECEHIQYVNPKIIAGTLPYLYENGILKILLCKRAIEPRYGRWTLPAGFMEMNEDIETAAKRETLEEACAQCEIDHLYTITSIPEIGQVHMFYRAKLTSDFKSGPESLEVALFELNEIPWDELSFSTVYKTLKQFEEDIQNNNNFNLHTFITHSRQPAPTEG